MFVGLVLVFVILVLTDHNQINFFAHQVLLDFVLTVIVVLRLFQNHLAEYYQLFYKNSNYIKVIDSTFVGPAPIITSAMFSSDGQSIDILFYQSTNKALLYDNFKCSHLFSFYGVDNTLCTWLNFANIRISNLTLLKVDSRIVVAKDTTYISKLKTMSLFSDPFTPWPSIDISTSVIVSSPYLPIVPLIIISGPPVIDSCFDLELDISGSSGHAGRNWKSTTVLVSSTKFTNNSILEASCQQQLIAPFQRIFISSKLLNADVSYSFFFTFCNWFDNCGSGYFNVYISNASTPYISLIGSQIRNIKNYENLAIYSSLKSSSCFNYNISKVIWEVYKSNVQPSSSRLGPNPT